MDVFEVAILIDIEDIGTDELFVGVIDLFVDDGDLLPSFLVLFDEWAKVNRGDNLWRLENED
jgi:hypothetical protein